MYQTIDLVISSACIGICTLLSMHLVLSRKISRKTVSALGMLLAISAMVIISTMTIEEHMVRSNNLRLLNAVIASVSPVLIAWGLLELFIDEFRIRKWQIAFVSLTIPTHFLAWLHPAFAYVCHLSSMMIYAYLLYIAVRTNRNDLVEDRMKFRYWFMTTAAIDGVLLTSIHLWFGYTELPVWYHMVKAVSIFALTLIFAYWALLVRNNLWAAPDSKPLASTETLSMSEIALLRKLKASMRENVWKQEGLTIRKLAEILDAPEHRLRKVINQGLGYRNFTAFVNEHRIGAACEVLSDPVRADVPVISIAYDVGYASLGPFNRAFREIVGESPTEYRRRLFSHA